MTTPIERALAEGDELAERLNALVAFLQSPQFTTLHEVDQQLLVAQKGSMESYLTILGLRVSRMQMQSNVFIPPKPGIILPN